MKLAPVLGAPLILMALSGCVSSGSIVKVLGNREIEVAVTDDFVKVGDPVSIYKAECNTPYYTRYRHCRDEKIGEGKITARLADRATVKTTAQVGLSGSNFVQWAYPQ
jgi:hypothetical protein